MDGCEREVGDEFVGDEFCPDESGDSEEFGARNAHEECERVEQVSKYEVEREVVDAKALADPRQQAVAGVDERKDREHVGQYLACHEQAEAARGEEAHEAEAKLTNAKDRAAANLQPYGKTLPLQHEPPVGYRADGTRSRDVKADAGDQKSSLKHEAVLALPSKSMLS